MNRPPQIDSLNSSSQNQAILQNKSDGFFSDVSIEKLESDQNNDVPTFPSFNGLQYTKLAEKNKYSLKPDMILGWQPKLEYLLNRNNELNDFKLKYSVDYIDQIFEEQRDQVVYKGFRARNSKELMLRYANKTITDTNLLVGLLRN